MADLRQEGVGSDDLEQGRGHRDCPGLWLGRRPARHLRRRILAGALHAALGPEPVVPGQSRPCHEAPGRGPRDGGRPCGGRESEAGRMLGPSLRAAAYGDGAGRPAAALDAEPPAAAFFATLRSANRYAVIYRVNDAKTAKTRAERIAKFVTMLARGETLHTRAGRASSSPTSSIKG